MPGPARDTTPGRIYQFGARRVTRDIDILGRAFPGDEQEIIRRITQIAATTVT